MKTLEAQSITAAQDILHLAEQPGATQTALQDISVDDRRSSQISREIQQDAVQVQKSLGHVAAEMKGARVPESKLKKMSQQLWKMAEEVDKAEMGTLGEDSSASNLKSAEDRKREAGLVEEEA